MLHGVFEFSLDGKSSCISYGNAYAKHLLQGEGEKNHVGTIIEFFKTTDGDNYFRGQWFYRVEDTVS